MDEVERFIETFRGRVDWSVVCKLDALMDIVQIRDPRVLPFLLSVFTDEREPVEVRVHVLKRLRNETLSNGLRESIAGALRHTIQDQSPQQLRLHAALALAEFADIDGVPAPLGAAALNPDVPLDIRHVACLRDPDQHRSASHSFDSWC